MGGSLLFVHGTGAHDISGSLGRIREGVAQFAELQDVRVHGAQWGIAVGPKDLDVTPALPPAVASRGLGDEPTEDEVALEEGDLLVTDPLLELRLLAALPGGADEGGVIVAADPADVVLHQRLSSLQVSPESLAAAGIDAPALAAAGAAVAASPELAEAAGAVGDPDDADLLAATARAVVATVLQPCL